jgi:hypothetical protein
MTTDEQEALSRRFGNEVIIILALRSTNWAIFNSARELCAIVQAGAVQEAAIAVAAQAALRGFDYGHSPALETLEAQREQNMINLEELGL